MAYLNNDGVIFFWSKIKEFFVAKESGKGLSTNDYTTAEKNKLSGIATGATKNTVENVLTSTSTTNALSAYQGKVLNDKIGNVSDSGMLKSIYDTDGNGIVDNAEKVNGFTVGCDVPANAVFTDTTYEMKVDKYENSVHIVFTSSEEILEGPISGASSSKAGVMIASDKAKLDALPTNATLESTYAKKTDITGVYKYKGSVANASNLPTTGQTKGDVYNIESVSAYGGAGANVAWDGSKWDALGEIFTITAITNAELDTICV